MRSKSALFAIIAAMGIDKLTPAEITAVKSKNKRLRSSNIRRKGNVVHIAKANKIVARLRWLAIGIGASEEEYKVDLVVCDPGGDLLGSARVARKEGLYFKSGRIGYVLAGDVRSTKVMCGEYSAIRDTKLSHKLLFVVVCYDRYIHYDASVPRVCHASKF